MWIKKAASFIGDVQKERVRLWCLECLELGVTVSISEVACTEPGCPPVKTTILVFRDGQPTTSCIIHKPIKAINRSDVVAACSGSVSLS